MMLGVITAQLGALPQAINHLQRATQIQPDSASAWGNLGLALLSMNKLIDAESCLRRATELDPKDSGVYNTLGALYRQQGKIDAAIHAYQEAIRRQPRDANAHSNLGGILQEQCRTDEAIASYRRALKIAPRFAQAEFNLGSALQGSGQHEQAIYHFRKALQLQPDLADATAAIASIQEKEGHLEEAMNTIAPLLKDGATHAQAAVTYADVARRAGETARAIELLEAVSRRANLSNVDRQDIEFALGDLFDQQGEYDTAFTHYHRANDIRPYHFDSAAHEARIRRIIEHFPLGSLPLADSCADQYPPAVFIVGMPRSSTSLVEQILASHPEVHGGGELPYMGSLIDHYSHDKQTAFPALLDRMSPQDIRTFGERYLKQLRALNNKARFITDKMPHNFMHLGLIAQAIPGVRIIHTRRNALDTCLSIYFHNFNANHPYATSLANLGYYYRAVRTVDGPLARSPRSTTARNALRGAARRPRGHDAMPAGALRPAMAPGLSGIP